MNDLYNIHICKISALRKKCAKIILFTLLNKYTTELTKRALRDWSLRKGKRGGGGGRQLEKWRLDNV